MVDDVLASAPRGQVDSDGYYPRHGRLHEAALPRDTPPKWEVNDQFKDQKKWTSITSKGTHFFGFWGRNPPSCEG